MWIFWERRSKLIQIWDENVGHELVIVTYYIGQTPMWQQGMGHVRGIVALVLPVGLIWTLGYSAFSNSLTLSCLTVWSSLLSASRMPINNWKNKPDSGMLLHVWCSFGASLEIQITFGHLRAFAWLPVGKKKPVIFPVERLIFGINEIHLPVPHHDCSFLCLCSLRPTRTRRWSAACTTCRAGSPLSCSTRSAAASTSPARPSSSWPSRTRCLPCQRVSAFSSSSSAQECSLTELLVVLSCFSCAWDRCEHVLVLCSIVTGFPCILPSLSLCRDVSFRGEVVSLLSLLVKINTIPGDCALSPQVCLSLSGWHGRAPVWPASLNLKQVLL